LTETKIIEKIFKQEISHHLEEKKFFGFMRDFQKDQQNSKFLDKKFFTFSERIFL